MSYAEIDLATVPRRPDPEEPANDLLAAPISAIVPYQRGSRLMRRLLMRVGLMGARHKLAHTSPCLLTCRYSV